MSLQIVKVRHLLNALNKELKEQEKRGTKYKYQFLNSPVVLGDDNELNGVHELYYQQIVDFRNQEDLNDFSDFKTTIDGWYEAQAEKKPSQVYLLS